jgi:hypothetical protein
VAVLDSAGKLVREAILETKAETILQFIRGLRGSLHVTFEEGTSAAFHEKAGECQVCFFFFFLSCKDVFVLLFLL